MGWRAGLARLTSVLTATFLLLCLACLGTGPVSRPNLQLPPQRTGLADEYRIGGGDQVQAGRQARIIESKFWPASLTLAEEEGLGWCRVGKVGTTAWSALFLLLRSVPLPDIQAAVANLTAHDLLKQLYPSRPSERMHMVKGEHGKHYTTFLAVRHPFARLLSAYRDKLETLTEYNARYHVKDAVKMSARRVFNSTVGDSPSFPEFVDYLVRTPPNLMDKHWAPYTKLCLPCNISYTAVVKLETLEQDADWLFPRLGLQRLRAAWDSVADGRVHSGPGGAGGRTSDQLASTYYGQLTKRQVTRLYNKYKVDFEMFDYDSQVQTYVDMARSEP